jgi:hypothetical protein
LAVIEDDGNVRVVTREPTIVSFVEKPGAKPGK